MTLCSEKRFLFKIFCWLYYQWFNQKLIHGIAFTDKYTKLFAQNKLYFLMPLSLCLFSICLECFFPLFPLDENLPLEKLNLNTSALNLFHLLLAETAPFFVFCISFSALYYACACFHLFCPVSTWSSCQILGEHFESAELT